MGFLDNKRRRRDHRPEISATEKRVGWFILLLLVGIAVAVYLKGQHYDSRLFALDVSALENTSQAAQSIDFVDTTDDITATETASGVLPPSIEGWEPFGGVESFNPENLYVKIDGRAEQYLAYDFVGLETVSLTRADNPERFIDIFIYDMGNDTNAFGVFSVERSPGENVEIGNEGYMSGPGLFFQKGRYYNQVLAVDDTPEIRETVLQIGHWLDQQQASGESAFSAFDLFPTENRISDSTEYFKTDALGLKFLNDVYAVSYDREGVEILAFLTQRVSEDEVQQIAEQYRGYLERYGTLLDPLETEAMTYLRGDMGGFYDVVFQKGVYFGGVNFASDQRLAEEVAEALANALP